ncbi:MAG TPA: tetratricopeptide repeat protein [Fimbriimonadaceae bacterium]|nr:tetratricopeptide repeat protein [Fimbriimonadaceae bacterium]
MRRVLPAVFLALIGSASYAQSWNVAYEKGLDAAKHGNWSEARAAFQQAVAYRPEDVSAPTTMPGPVTERRQWRDGAPYSPNFLAAYCEYRIGTSSPTPEKGRTALVAAGVEFEALLAKGEVSRETLYFLDQIYGRTGDTAKRLDVEARAKSVKPTFRVDDAIVAPEELAMITGSTPVAHKQGEGPVITIIQPGENPRIVTNPNTNPNLNEIPAPGGAVPIVPTKFALIIGNSTSQLKQGAVTFGASDAQAVRAALVMDAGYNDSNVDLVLNTTRDQLLASAKALAERVPEDGTVFIFFAGNGANIEGKDYLAGVDTTSDSDASTMVAKSEIYQMFMAKGAKIYAFFESPRPMTDGNYFGKEVPMVGAIAQVQSTIPGQSITAQVYNGTTLGVFAEAMVTALHDIRSNHIPIMEFGWQVFNRTRGGGDMASGMGAGQVPTLPVLSNMSDDDRF